MVSTSGLDTDGGRFGLGTLTPQWMFGSEPEKAIALPDYTPVLTFNMEVRNIDELRSRYRPTSFGWSFIEIGDCLLMIFCLQVGDVQFHWVAHATDPDLWEAIEMWKRAGKVTTLLRVAEGERRRILIGAAEISSHTPSLSSDWHGPDHAPTAETLQKLASVVASGLLKSQATSDIPGIELRHVFANVLLTKRLEPFLNDSPLVIDATWSNG
ncbi:hypothetical protein FSB08_25170 [Paraburkholderia sp. JPY432]|uniref:hypothetical protein n=1 Tax=Paraburkholderia youngii TaxID=2782701 RepID=UPI0015963587|nr:hypothetical protein [Paraburkholderia youngii]NVH75742.1 hypothetical protein [Paraburkholderia youngii]